MFEYQSRLFAMKINCDQLAPTARSRIQGILKQLEWPTNARGMRVAAGLMYACAYPSSLIASVLLTKRPPEEVVCFLGHGGNDKLFVAASPGSIAFLTP